MKALSFSKRMKTKHCREAKLKGERRSWRKRNRESARRVGNRERKSERWGELIVKKNVIKNLRTILCTKCFKKKFLEIERRYTF